MQIQDWQRKTITQTVRWYLRRKGGRFGMSPSDMTSLQDDIEGEVMVQVADAWDALCSMPERNMTNWICRVMDRRLSAWLRQYKSCGNNSMSEGTWSSVITRDEQEPQDRAQAESLADRALALLRRHEHFPNRSSRDDLTRYFMGECERAPGVVVSLKRIIRKHYPEFHYHNRANFEMVNWIQRHAEHIPSLSENHRGMILELLEHRGSHTRASKKSRTDWRTYKNALLALSEEASRANSTRFLEKTTQPGWKVRAV